nr:hypothetical protein [Tanacetum cinerariifolium]
EETRDEESFDPIPKTPESSEDEGNGEEDQGLRISEEERLNEEAEAEELYRDMTKAVRVAVQIQTNWLRDSYQRENDEFLQTIDENMKRIIKEQTNWLRDSYQRENDEFLRTIDENMKRIIKEQMEGNKSIQRSDEQRNLYKALFDAYEADKTILDSYGETVILKRRHVPSSRRFLLLQMYLKFTCRNYGLQLMIPGQSFDELPFEEEILEFLRFLGHSAQIRRLTDIHKGHHTSLHVKGSVNPKTKQGAMLPIELTNEEIRNTKAYKEYYAYATREAAPKPKASARRKKSGSDTSITPPTAITTPTTTVAVTPRLTAAVNRKQPAKAKSPSDPSELARTQAQRLKINKKSHGTLRMMKMLMLKKRTEMTMKAMRKMKVARTEAQQLKIVLRRSRQQTHISQLGGSGTDEGTGSKPGVPNVPTDESEEELSWNSSDDECLMIKKRSVMMMKVKRVMIVKKEKRMMKTKMVMKEMIMIKIRRLQSMMTRMILRKVGDVDEEGENDKEDYNEETRDEESFDPIPKTPESSEDEGNGEEDQGLRISEEERLNEEAEAEEL